MCLSDPNQDIVPSASEKFCLKESGLVETKIVFPISAGWEKMKEEILRSFPKLRCGGGIELLRTDGPYSKSLTKISPQQLTSVSKLKEYMQQARIYVRPIQCSLDLELPEDREDIEVRISCNTYYICEGTDTYDNTCINLPIIIIGRMMYKAMKLATCVDFP